MPALDSVGTTEHMTPAQLEFFGKLFLAENRTYQLAPWFMGIWLDTLLLGLMLVLYAQWQAGSAKTDQKWSKVTVVSISPFRRAYEGERRSDTDTETE